MGDLVEALNMVAASYELDVFNDEDNTDFDFVGEFLARHGDYILR